jgi:hypothetical protein
VEEDGWSPLHFAAKEVHHKIMVEATKGLPASVKAVASKLVQAAPTSKLVDCTKIEAYDVLKNAFSTLNANLTSANATIHAEDKKLETAFNTAYEAFLVSEAAYRSAASAHESAEKAEEYAKGQFDKFNSAVAAGQTEYDSTVPGLEIEKDDLITQQPILEQVKTLVANMATSVAAKGKVVSLKQLPAIKKLAAAIYEPKRFKDKALKGKILALRTSLAETGTSSTMNGMVTILDEIISSMSARVTEIDATLAQMSTDLATNKASQGEWREKLVDLGDDKDKAENTKTTTDLERNVLSGKQQSASEAYQDYHAGFVDQAAELKSQLRAIATIGAKINEAIASCAAA